MQSRIILGLAVVACVLALTSANPEAPSSGYGAPSGYSSGGHGGGWGQEQQQGWGWVPPKRYLSFSIPIPQLPRIRLGINAGIKASVSHGQGWGWK